MTIGYQSKVALSMNIVDEINSLDSEWKLIAHDNESVPSDILSFVLQKVVPLSDVETARIISSIKELKQDQVYSGKRDHCEKIKSALATINIKSEIKK